MSNNSIAEKIKNIKNELVSFKTAQPIGSQSVRVSNIQTNNLWDYEWTPTQLDASATGGYEAHILVTYISSFQQAPFASIRIIAEINGLRYDPTTKPPFVSGSSDPGIDVYGNIFGTGLGGTVGGSNTVQWRVDLNANSLNTTIKLKFLIKATDIGSIVHERV